MNKPFINLIIITAMTRFLLYKQNNKQFRYERHQISHTVSHRVRML